MSIIQRFVSGIVQILVHQLNRNLFPLRKRTAKFWLLLMSLLFVFAYGLRDGTGIYKVLFRTVFGRKSQEQFNPNLVKKMSMKIENRNLSISIGIYRMLCGTGDFTSAFVLRSKLDNLLPKFTVDDLEEKSAIEKQVPKDISLVRDYSSATSDRAGTTRQNRSITDVRGSEINVYGPSPGAFGDFQLRNPSEISAIMVNRKMLTSLAKENNLSNVIAYVDGKLASLDLTKAEMATILNFMAVRQGLGKIPKRDNFGIRRTLEVNDFVSMVP